MSGELQRTGYKQSSVTKVTGVTMVLLGSGYLRVCQYSLSCVLRFLCTYHFSKPKAQENYPDYLVVQSMILMTPSEVSALKFNRPHLLSMCRTSLWLLTLEMEPRVWYVLGNALALCHPPRLLFGLPLIPSLG